LPLEPHPRRAELKAFIVSHHELHRAWSGIVYRGTRIEFAGDGEFLSGEGSFLHGGRWNAPEVGRAVYTSLDHKTVVEEASAGDRVFGILKALPMTIRAVRCELQLVIDLTANLAGLGLMLEDVAGADWRAQNQEGREAISQAIGYASHGAGLEGILVPSALGKGTNLVIFPGNILKNSHLSLDPNT